MITSINEMLFSKHYVNDGSKTRFNRIREIQIVTTLDNLDLGYARLKSALYNLALSKLDEINNQNYVVYVIPKITFIENGKNKVATLKGDAGVGNSFVFICEGGKVLTAYLSRSNNYNDILEQSKAHTNKDLNGIYSLLDGHIYNKEIDDNTIINLDINDIEFNKQYPPFTALKNNNIKNILTQPELSKLENDLHNYEKNKPADVIMSGGFIVHNMGDATVDNKEFVVGTPGEEIYMYVNGEPKIKTIRRVYRDEKSKPMKVFIEFERTAQPTELKEGMQFIIKPKVDNEETIKLKEQFGIDLNKEVYFSGKIVKTTYYLKSKTKTVDKVGVIIKPTQVLEL